MADIGPRGKPVDARAKEIKRRRITHEIHSMEMTIEKFEIDILEAEQAIARTQESIEATRERAKAKQAELDLLMKEKEDG